MMQYFTNIMFLEKNTIFLKQTLISLLTPPKRKRLRKLEKRALLRYLFYLHVQTAKPRLLIILNFCGHIHEYTILYTLCHNVFASCYHLNVTSVNNRRWLTSYVKCLARWTCGLVICHID